MQARVTKHIVTQAHLQRAAIQSLQWHRTSCQGLQQRHLHTQLGGEFWNIPDHLSASSQAQHSAQDRTLVYTTCPSSPLHVAEYYDVGIRVASASHHNGLSALLVTSPQPAHKDSWCSARLLGADEMSQPR